MADTNGNTINTLSLCAGVGWLDLGFGLACEHLGYRHRVVGYVERDAYAAACLMARMEDSSLGRTPVWCGDMRGLDARPMRGWVDAVVAGLPCQPYSAAGKQRGHDDDRSYGGDGDGPLAQAIRIIGECEPSLVFLENVPTWASGGWFRRFGEELCGMGYEIESPLFVTAQSVGASHRRERVFIMAHRPVARSRGVPKSDGRHDVADVDGCGSELADAESIRTHDDIAGWNGEGVSDATRGSNFVVNAGCERRQAGNLRLQRSGDQPAGRQADDIGERRGGMGDTQRCGRCEGNGGVETETTEVIAIGRGTPLFAPGPSDFDGWDRVVADGEYDFRAPAVKPGVRVLVDGHALVVDASRADQLRCAGNGCVPIQAAVAAVELLRRVIDAN